MSSYKKSPYPKIATANTQQGAVLIVVLLFLVLIIFAGVIAVRQSTTDLRLATADQVNTLLLQSADDANQNIEQSINGNSSSDIYDAMLSSTGPFGYFILNPDSRNDEFVFCFRPRGQFFNINKTSISVADENGVISGNVLGSGNGYCNPSTPEDYVSKRNASMTQVSVALTPTTSAAEPFSTSVIGQDSNEVSSQAFLFDINSTAILPAYAGGANKAADCLKRTSLYASVTNKENTIAGCLAKEGIPSTVLYEMASVENQSSRTKCINLGSGSVKSSDLLCSLASN